MSSRPSSRPETDSDQAACSRKALDLLARREHSRLELERKLLARKFADSVIAPALDALERSGALSAERFVDSFVRERALRGHGPVRIRMELIERGIAEAQFQELLRSGEYDWRALAHAVRAKRFGATRPKDFEERARQGQFLQYRGFDFVQIDNALEVGDDSD